VAFWKATAELVGVAFAATFLGLATSGGWSVVHLEDALKAAGVAAVAALYRQFSGVQALKTGTSK